MFAGVKIGARAALVLKCGPHIKKKSSARGARIATGAHPQRCGVPRIFCTQFREARARDAECLSLATAGGGQCCRGRGASADSAPQRAPLAQHAPLLAPSSGREASLAPRVVDAGAGALRAPGGCQAAIARG